MVRCSLPSKTEEEDEEEKEVPFWGRAEFMERPHPFRSPSHGSGDMQQVSLGEGRKGNSTKSVYKVYTLQEGKATSSLPVDVPLVELADLPCCYQGWKRTLGRKRGEPGREEASLRVTAAEDRGERGLRACEGVLQLGRVLSAPEAPAGSGQGLRKR